MELVFQRNRLQNKVLLHNGYLFRVSKRKPKRSYWKCTTSNCKAGVCLDVEEKTILSINGIHSHPANPAEVEGRKFHEALRDRILNDRNTPIPEIYRKELSKMHLSPEILAQMPTFNSMRHFMYNVRSSTRPPVSDEKLQLDGIWRTASDGKSFVRMDEESSQLVSCPTTETNTNESNGVSTPIAESEQQIAAPILSSSEKENSNQFADGYLLYAREVRRSFIAANPNKSFGDISHLIQTEWRQLPDLRKEDYEERAQKRNELKQARLLERPPTAATQRSTVDTSLRCECLWDSCDHTFENKNDLIYHLAMEPNGHIRQTFKNKDSEEFELQCMWYNCQRIKENFLPFPNVAHLIRHVKEVHLKWNPTKLIAKKKCPAHRKKMMTATRPSQTDPTIYIAQAPPPANTEEPSPATTEKPPPTNTEEPLLNIQILNPVSISSSEAKENLKPKAIVHETPLLVTKPNVDQADYVFEGRRMVNMGYFIKSLQMLNDHDGRKCNFSDMRVCGETNNTWNFGIVFQCKLCPTTKVIWLEDPSIIEETPLAPFIFKPQVQKSTIEANLHVPSPQLQRFSSQPCQSIQKAPTPPPGYFPPFEGPQIAMQMRELPNCSNTLLNGQNTTLSYNPQQTPFTEQLQVQPIIDPQVTANAQSQRSFTNQTQVSVIGQSQVSLNDQPQDPFVGLAQLVPQLQDSIFGQSPTHTNVQSQVPLIDSPQVASVKQEFILPDDGMNQHIVRSFINTSSEPTKVEMTFCVDQDETTTETASVPSDTYTAMDVTETITATPDAFAHTRTSLKWPSGQLSLSTAMDVTTTRDIAPTDTLPVDFNLVKKEINDETLCH